MSHIRPKGAVHKSWFSTDKGRRFTFYSANVAASSVILGHVLPHTMCVTNYRDFVRLYSKGFSVPVPENVIKRFEKTLDLLEITGFERTLYSPFMTCGFDMFSAGTHGRFGVYIGIPNNFGYDKVENIDRSRIKVNHESVVWDSNEGKQLLNALVIPENAQIYAMAAEIKMRRSFKLHFDTFYAVAACTLTYAGGLVLNKRMYLSHQPKPIRFLGYALIASFNFVNYIMCKDVTQNIYEEKIDKELKSLSPIFAEGGKQFYSKILERNKALRVLMGKEGESKYTVLGNENTLLRNKHRPIVQRKDFFEQEIKYEEVQGEVSNL